MIVLYFGIAAFIIFIASVMIWLHVERSKKKQ